LATRGDERPGRTASAEIDFSATNRKTKQLITLEGSRTASAAARSSKHSFQRDIRMRVGCRAERQRQDHTASLLRGEIEPEFGKIACRGMQIVYFDQNRELDPNYSAPALAPDSDA